MRHRKPHNHLRTKLLISRTFPSLNLETVEAVELSTSTVRQGRQCDSVESRSTVVDSGRQWSTVVDSDYCRNTVELSKTVDHCRTLLSNCRTGAQGAVCPDAILSRLGVALAAAIRGAGAPSELARARRRGAEGPGPASRNETTGGWMGVPVVVVSRLPRNGDIEKRRFHFLAKAS